MYLQAEPMEGIIISRGKKARPIWRPTQIHQYHKQISTISSKKKRKKGTKQISRKSRKRGNNKPSDAFKKVVGIRRVSPKLIVKSVSFKG